MNDWFPKLFELDEKEPESLYPNMMREFYITTGRANGKSAYLDRMYKDMLNRHYGYKQSKEYYFEIEKVIFNDPATIVIWADGSKTVVKCQDGDTFSKETGLAMAISKRALGDKSNYCEVFKKWIPEIEEASVATEVFFDDSNFGLSSRTLQEVFAQVSDNAKLAAQALEQTYSDIEYNILAHCNGCVNVDQDTDEKKLACRRCNYYSNFTEKEE